MLRSYWAQPWLTFTPPHPLPPGGALLWPSRRVHLHRPINTHACFSTGSLQRRLSILTCYPGPKHPSGGLTCFLSRAAGAIHQRWTFINLMTEYESIYHVFKHSLVTICKAELGHQRWPPFKELKNNHNKEAPRQKDGLSVIDVLCSGPL